MGIGARHDDLGLLWVEFTPEGHRPPLLTPDIIDFIDRLIADAAAEPPVGIVFTGREGGDFQAGVDLDEMAAVDTYQSAFEASRRGQLLFQRIADIACPTVAAVEGRCVGGGTELSLACTARIAADTETTAFILPEIHLGILCGFGGTQRLPRLIGQRRALQMILTGRPVPARQALEWGLVDRLATSGNLRREASGLVSDLLKGKTARRGDRVRRGPAGWLLDGTASGRKFVRKRSRRLVHARTGGHFPAPEMAIKAVGDSADGLDLGKGFLREAEMIGELITGDVHPHLVRIVRARQSLRRPRGRESESDKPVDLAAGLEIPAPISSALKESLTDLPAVRGDTEGEVGAPNISIPSGAGLLRRLPCARRPGVIEAVWLETAGEPDMFQDVARHAATAAGLSVVYCRPGLPSPGLSLVAAYLREGDRLIAEGWERARVDRILKEWGMEHGPFSLAERLGQRWLERLDRMPSRHPAAGTRRTIEGDGPNRSEAETHLVEEVAGALLLEMSGLWEVVLEPTEEGWLVLDVFALGGPSYCGGIAGAARRKESPAADC